MKRQPPVEAQLEALERCLLDASVRKSDQLEMLLAPGFVEIGGSGRRFDRDQIVASVRSEVDVLRTATDFQVELLAPTVALVTYTACRHSQPALHSLRMSLWQQNEAGSWKMRFHQGTLLAAQP